MGPTKDGVIDLWEAAAKACPELRACGELYGAPGALTCVEPETSGLYGGGNYQERRDQAAAREREVTNVAAFLQTLALALKREEGGD